MSEPMVKAQPDEPLVLFSVEDGVGIITLNRPPANSYNQEVMSQLGAAIDAADRDDNVRAVIVRSALAKFFSAGADIKAFLENDTESSLAMIRYAHGVLARMGESSKVFIAAINGHALGGGLEIALACDLRLAVEGRYKMGQVEINLGLLPGNGGTQRLPRLIGASRALELMITGQTIGPEEAHRMNIVNHLVPADEFETYTREFAARLAAAPTVAIGHIKKAVYGGLDLDLKAGLELEQQLIAPLFDTEDAREGFASFVEKRPAVFKGK